VIEGYISSNSNSSSSSAAAAAAAAAAISKQQQRQAAAAASSSSGKQRGLGQVCLSHCNGIGYIYIYTYRNSVAFVAVQELG